MYDDEPSLAPIFEGINEIMTGKSVIDIDRGMRKVKTCVNDLVESRYDALRRSQDNEDYSELNDKRVQAQGGI